MPLTHLSPAKPPRERYLTFSEREDIAIEAAKGALAWVEPIIFVCSAPLAEANSRNNVPKHRALPGGQSDYRWSSADYIREGNYTSVSQISGHEGCY